jgi:hypothetical protein
MASIYVHASALGASDATDWLSHLAEAGHRLVVVGDGPEPALLGTVDATEDDMPPDPPRGSWFVTGDPATCGDHRAGLTTLLVGPRLDERRPTRCDATARDLREAVLEILASVAMD